MGILREAVKQVDVMKGMKRNMVLDKLLELGIIKSQQGISIHQLDYEELKYELVLASFRQIDAENENNGWF